MSEQFSVKFKRTKHYYWSNKIEHNFLYKSFKLVDSKNIKEF